MTFFLSSLLLLYRLLSTRTALLIQDTNGPKLHFEIETLDHPVVYPDFEPDGTLSLSHISKQFKSNKTIQNKTKYTNTKMFQKK
jgi:hypothetical protein